MPLRSMTGFAQVKGQCGTTAFTLSVKSVNHRFLDLHLRLPANSDALEQKLRKLFKENLHRGHIEMTLTLEQSAGAGVSFNRELVGGYVEAFRRAAQEFGVAGEPDLNSILRINGAITANGELQSSEELEQAVLQTAENAISRLNSMRADEGAGLKRELLARLQELETNTAEVEQYRALVSKAYAEKIQQRLEELLSTQVEMDRILQEAAMMAERSDIHEEIVRMQTHIAHFRVLLDEKGEIGKKLDFLLQEMNREANTMLSKTGGITGEGLRITELGLALKSGIEKIREQVQNIE
ncbi:MAG TPA: YicC/YloC family endoribonuclease [candidate division Zixibacteria bacterium]|nr:YicC/YloC family endoribonuclease [candidate division Zixibacteria bacterium]